MKTYCIFLDVDGVLASERVYRTLTDKRSKNWAKFDPIAIDFLNTLVDKFDIEFVLSSTWRKFADNGDSFHWVESAFRNAGFHGKFAEAWKTPDLNDNSFSSRANEISAYLKEHGEKYHDYLIIDDIDFRFNHVLGRKRFVQTSLEDGLLNKHMKNILSLTGAWHDK